MSFDGRSSGGAVTVLALFLACCSLAAAGGTEPPPNPREDQGSYRAALAARLRIILDRDSMHVAAEEFARDLLGLGVGDGQAPVFVLDVREATDFSACRIPGAINIPLGRLPATLLQDRTAVPRDTRVVVASYHGGDGAMAALLLNLVSIGAAEPGAAATTPSTARPLVKAIFGGMPAWSLWCGGSEHRFDEALGQHRVARDAETRLPIIEDGHALPELPPFPDGAGTVSEQLLVQADRFLGGAKGAGPRTVTTVDLLRLVENDTPTDDPQILSTRRGFHYMLGHIPGAVNIPGDRLPEFDSHLGILDPRKPVFVYCYTGQSGGVAAMALGLLGYDAHSLLFGMNGWTTSPTALSGQLADFDLNWSWDFPVARGQSATTSLSGYRPESTGCRTCHADLTALSVSLWSDPAPETGRPRDEVNFCGKTNQSTPLAKRVWIVDRTDPRFAGAFAELPPSTCHDSCETCHGGDPQSGDRGAAHRSMAPLDQTKGCRSCHPQRSPSEHGLTHTSFQRYKALTRQPSAPP